MKSWIPIAGGAAAAAALGAVATELAARAWITKRGKYYTWHPHHKFDVHLDPEGLPWLPSVARWRINSAGERGQEPPKDWSDTARILVGGGSSSECYFIDQPSIWSEVLSAELNKPGVAQAFGASKVHVGNVSRSLTPSEDLATMFDKILPNYERLDVAMLFTGCSDVVQWMGLREPAEYPQADPPIQRLFGSHPEGPFGWSPGSLAIRRVASAMKARFSSKPDVLERAGKRLAELRARRTGAAHWIEKASDLTPMLNQYDGALRKLLRSMKAKAGRVLFIAQPWMDRDLQGEDHERTWNFGFGQPYKEELDTYYRFPVVCEMIHAIREKGLTVALEEGVEVYDMVHDIPCDWDHYYDSLHHTPRGNALIAKLIAARLTKKQ